MNESFLVRHAVRSGDVGSRQVTIIGLELDMDSSIFQSGRVEVKCMATMFQLYHSQAKVLLEEERPRLASVLGTRESSSPGGAAMRWKSQWLILPIIALSALYAR